MSTSLAGLRVALVGPGRVGLSLAGWLRGAGAAITSVAGRAVVGDATVVALGAARASTVDALTSAGDDLLLLAVPDDAIAAVAARLAEHPQARVVLHTSGALGESVLAPLRRPSSEASQGTAIGALHPLKAFPRPLPDPAAARGVLLAFAGDEPARALAWRLADAWGARLAAVPEEARLLYHFAATLAAGGVATLLAAAAELARRAGLPAELHDGYVELAHGALAESAAARHPADAITGPVARGDATLVLRELAALRETAPELHAMATLLARATLALRAGAVPGESAQAALDQQLARLGEVSGFLDPPRVG